MAVPAGRGLADALTTGRLPADPVATSAAAGPGASPTRDIYHIVLDRYSSDRAFQTGFDFDNSAFTSWLRDQGFQVMHDANANYAWTTLSLPSTFGMSLLDDIVEAAGPDSLDRTLLDRRVEESPVGRVLQGLGYEYVLVGSWFDQTQESSVADRVYRPRRVLTFASTLYDLTIAPFVLGEAQRGKLDSLTATPMRRPTSSGSSTSCAPNVAPSTSSRTSSSRILHMSSSRTARSIRTRRPCVRRSHTRTGCSSASWSRCWSCRKTSVPSS